MSGLFFAVLQGGVASSPGFFLPTHHVFHVIDDNLAVSMWPGKRAFLAFRDGAHGDLDHHNVHLVFGEKVMSHGYARYIPDCPSACRSPAPG